MVEVTQEINAPAELVYDLVSDLPNMGRWSPENTAVHWRGGATGPEVGAKFRGTNRHGLLVWSTFGTILTAERGKDFSFEVAFGPLAVSRWGYRFEPLPDGGCRVTEWTEDLRGQLLKQGSKLVGMGDREGMNQASMQVTLDRLKQAAETSTATRG